MSDTITYQELGGLLTPTKAADLKGMSLHLFKYHLKHRHDAPTPILVGTTGLKFYREADIIGWNPQVKLTTKGE